MPSVETLPTAPTPPPEAPPPPPRPPAGRAAAQLWFYGSTANLVPVLGLGAAALGIPPFLLFAWLGTIDETLVLVSSRPTTATITKVRQGSTRRPAQVDYQYKDGGFTYQGSAPIPQAAAKLGARLEVDVSTLSPSASRPAGAPPGWVFGWLFALWVPIGVTMALLGVRSVRRLRRAFEHGTAVDAVVVPTPPNTKIGARAYYAEYALAGTRRQAYVVDSSQTARRAVGEQVTLLVHPAAPDVVVPWSPGLPRQ